MALYKRGDNWYIDFTFHGQRIREMIGPSRKGAEKVIAKRKAEIAENKFLDKRKEPDPVKFYDFAKEYLQWSNANKKPTSYRRDLSLMRQLNKEFETKAIQEITTWQIEKYKAKRKEEINRPGAVMGSFKRERKDGSQEEIWYVDYRGPQGDKVRKIIGPSKKDAEAYFAKSKATTQPATVNRELALLKHMYSKAIEWGRYEENPAKKVKLLKGEVKRVRFLMPDDVQKLLSNCADHLKPIVTVAVHTGMRKGELLSLNWDQVNFEQGIISLLDTKNHKRRDISMNETVKATLTGMERKGSYVFSAEDGGSFGDVRRSFETALRRSGIQDFRFHDLRHTFASNLVMESVDIVTVMELMGHKDLTMTLRYTHLAPNHKTKAVNILDRVLSLNPPQSAVSQKVVSLRP
jgi:integrase